MSNPSWNDRVTILSVNPDATRDDVARLAADLMACRACICEFLYFADEDINQADPDNSNVTARYLAAWKKGKELTV